MYARGMSVLDKQSCLLDMYKVDISEKDLSASSRCHYNFSADYQKFETTSV